MHLFHAFKALSAKTLLGLLAMLTLQAMPGTQAPALAQLPPGVSLSKEAEKLMKEMPPLDKPLNLKFCIFDLMGRAGPVYSIAKDLAVQAQRWNVFTELLVFNNESVAYNTFTTGGCDGVAMSTLRARTLNSFIGSLDSVGSVPSYKHMRATLQMLMGNEKLNPLTIQGKYQVAGIAPLGAAYVIVNDRKINSIEKAAGKKVAVLEWDKSQATMIERIGAQPIASDITSFATMFNNGRVDIIAAPAMALAPLELYKGMGDKGAIFRLPLVNITGTAVINRERFLRDIPDLDDRIVKMRKFGLAYIDQAFAAIEQAEKTVPARYWLELSDADKAKYNVMMREARISMTKDGVYDPRMMTLLKRVRCQIDAAAAECAQHDE